MIVVCVDGMICLLARYGHLVDLLKFESLIYYNENNLCQLM